MEIFHGGLSRVDAERIIAILEDTTDKLGFLDRLDFCVELKPAILF
jgi:hypothetical protein